MQIEYPKNYDPNKVVKTTNSPESRCPKVINDIAPFEVFEDADNSKSLEPTFSLTVAEEAITTLSSSELAYLTTELLNMIYLAIQSDASGLYTYSQILNGLADNFADLTTEFMDTTLQEDLNIVSSKDDLDDDLDLDREINDYDAAHSVAIDDEEAYWEGYSFQKPNKNYLHNYQDYGYCDYENAFVEQERAYMEQYAAEHAYLNAEFEEANTSQLKKQPRPKVDCWYPGSLFYIDDDDILYASESDYLIDRNPKELGTPMDLVGFCKDLATALHNYNVDMGFKLQIPASMILLAIMELYNWKSSDIAKTSGKCYYLKFKTDKHKDYLYHYQTFRELLCLNISHIYEVTEKSVTSNDDPGILESLEKDIETIIDECYVVNI